MRDGPADNELWQGLRNGDRHSLELLYKRHFPILLRYGNKICFSPELVKDCLQDLFFQLWEKKEKLHEVKSVRFYLMKWMKRDLIRKLNSKKGGQNLISLDPDSELPEVAAEDFFDVRELQTRNAIALRQILGRLSNREREVIYLRFFMNLPYEEISAVMNVGYQVVMNYMHRAMKELRENEDLKRIAGIMLIVFAEVVVLFRNAFQN